MKPILILTTVPNNNVALAISRLLVEKKLVACAQILPGITSIYIWEDKICEEGEHFLILKTLEHKSVEVKDAIVLHHPYSIPEVISLPIDSLNSQYSEWLLQSINK